MTFHLKDVGDALYPSNTYNRVTFVQSIILGSTLFIILTFLSYPGWFMTFSNNIVTSSLL